MVLFTFKTNKKMNENILSGYDRIEDFEHGPGYLDEIEAAKELLGKETIDKEVIELSNELFKAYDAEREYELKKVQTLEEVSNNKRETRLGFVSNIIKSALAFAGTIIGYGVYNAATEKVMEYEKTGIIRSKAFPGTGFKDVNVFKEKM